MLIVFAVWFKDWGLSFSISKGLGSSFFQSVWTWPWVRAGDRSDLLFLRVEIN